MESACATCPKAKLSPFTKRRNWRAPGSLSDSGIGCMSGIWNAEDSTE